MRSAIAVLTLGGMLAASAAAATADPVWIVTLEGPSAVERAVAAGAPVRDTLAKSGARQALLDAVAADHTRALERAQVALGRALQPVQRYQYGGNGFALRMDATEAQRLRDLPGVRSVVADSVQVLHTDAGPRWIGVEPVWAGTVGGAPNRGEGVVVGVIDTGISASHPAFAATGQDGFTHVNPRGRRFGLCTSTAASRCNDKLIGIHDFTQEGNRDGSDLDGHGTHVAATAAGNVYAGALSAPTSNVALNLSGVAPHANLISYKACTADGNNGTCTGSALLAALDQAIADGVDILNYSIGGTSRDPWGLLAQNSDVRSMLNARAAGIVVVVSAGNGGPLPGSISAPANAPWVLAAANSTHDRVFETELTELTGLAPPRISFKGQSLSVGMTGTAPIVLGESRGHALCSTGTGIDFPPTGASNPFAAGSLNGLIVVCDRGVASRVAKGFNVRAAGAVGMVLVNTAAEGESIVADGHYLPSTHLGATSGEVLKNWLRTTPDARGRITATRAASDPAAGDILSASTSRGPDLGGAGVLKPNLAAPGTGILAADHQSAGVVSKSGTSMAAPHIAGAAALIKAVRRDWGPDQIMSTLVLSAIPGTGSDGTGRPLTPLTTGNGRTQVQAALGAGLYLPLPAAAFGSANPRQGGAPAGLNLPEIYSEACRSRCNFTRTFTAVRAGSWRVEPAVEGGALVTPMPTSFTLAAGQSQAVEFLVDVGAPAAVGQWNQGRVLLVEAGAPAASSLSLPVMVKSDAGMSTTPIVLALDATAGAVTVNLSGLVALNGAHYSVLGPAPVQSLGFTLGADTADTSDAFADPAGTRTEWLSVEAGGGIAAQINAAADVDLYVGRDSNGDNAVSVGEALCAERSGSASERCALGGLEAGRYWVRVHNPSANSRVTTLELASLAPGLAHASGAARSTDGMDLSLQLAYDLSQVAPGTRQFALLQVRAGFDVQRPFATRLLDLRPTANAIRLPTVLHPGEPRTVWVQPAGTVDAAAFDAADAGSVRVESNAAIGVQLLAGPDLPSAAGLLPSGSPTVRGSGTANAGTPLDLAHPAGAARHYVRLSNTSGSGVTVRLQRQRGNLAAASGLRTGMYYNPARAGHGLFLSRARDDLQVAWYTYDSAGQPTFYLAFAANAFAGDFVKAETSLRLNRYSWDGGAALGQPVGTATLLATPDSGLQWTWTLDHASSSEPMVRLAENTCVATGAGSLDLSGLWFNPELPGYGASVFTRPDLEIYAVYLYDSLGLPRWLWNDTGSFGQAEVPLYQYRGFCPGCTYTPTTRTAVGTLRRSYSGAPQTPGAAPTGTWSIEASYAAGVPAGQWRSSGPLLMLTAPGTCN